MAGGAYKRYSVSVLRGESRTLPLFTFTNKKITKVAHCTVQTQLQRKRTNNCLHKQTRLSLIKTRVITNNKLIAPYKLKQIKFKSSYI